MQGEFGDVQVLGEIVKRARQNLRQDAWDFLIGGSESETSLRANRRALDRLAFRPRVLRDIRDVDLSIELFGTRQRIPVVLAPLGGLQLIHADAMSPAVRAAEAFGVSAFVSSAVDPGFEALRCESTGHLIFQLYTRGELDWIFEQFDRARDIGYQGICLTLDTAVYGRRERDLSKNFQPLDRDAAARRTSFQPGLDWEVAARVRERYDLTFVLKGVATVADAERAAELGIDAVHISNHGGRQLDFGPGTIDLVARIAEAVKGRAEVIVDGAFCRGTDILKALALGADGVAIGRLYGWGLAAGGEEGVLRVLEILEAELTNAIVNLGVTRAADLGPEFITRARSVRAPTVTSAFPLIDTGVFHY